MMATIGKYTVLFLMCSIALSIASHWGTMLAGWIAGNTVAGLWWSFFEESKWLASK